MIKHIAAHRTSILVIFLICLALIVLFFNVPQQTDFQRDTWNVSVVLRDNNMSNWENMKQGALQAGEDMNASIHFVNLQYNSIEEQIKTIKEEGRGITDAMVISPFASSKTMNEILKKIKMPVIMAESKSDLPYMYIGVDQRMMGEALAQEVMRHGNYRRKILLVTPYTYNISTKECMQAFLTAMKKTNNTVEVVRLDQLTSEEVKQQCVKKKADVIVSIDRVISKIVVEGVNQMITSHKPEIYTIGSSPDIINHLENNLIISTVVQDDFSIGYLAIKALIKELEHKTFDNQNIRYMMIDKEHMYQEASEKLLFPFVR